MRPGPLGVAEHRDDRDVVHGHALPHQVRDLGEHARSVLRAAQELFRLANPAPFVELQQRFAREYTDTLLRNSATLVRAVRRTADETLRPLEEQIRQADQGQRSLQTAAE